MSNEYVPTTEEIREAWVIVDEPDTRLAPPLWIGAEFDRWLLAHDAALVAAERERCARIAETRPLFREGVQITRPVDVAAAIRKESL